MASPNENAIVAGIVAGRIFGISGAAERLGISVSTLKRGWPKGDYPAPIRTSNSRIGFLESDIIRWQRERIAERDARVMQKSA
ncbi:helix-turn-helix transcriptional regulator [Hyphomicrobium sp. 2TAF46]|uniref:helix-turn-helix transcriptional regulator n=1 Tax=Hyphomicrobium sp. 2TAF46 TaxID=3233019 RepID=UPI003F92B501